MAAYLNIVDFLPRTRLVWGRSAVLVQCFTNAFHLASDEFFSRHSQDNILLCQLSPPESSVELGNAFRVFRCVGAKLPLWRSIMLKEKNEVLWHYDLILMASKLAFHILIISFWYEIKSETNFWLLQKVPGSCVQCDSFEWASFYRARNQNSWSAKQALRTPARVHQQKDQESLKRGDHYECPDGALHEDRCV